MVLAVAACGSQAGCREALAEEARADCVAAHLSEPLQVGSLRLRNRLYRAPVLEVVGHRSDAAAILVRELGPSAAGGCGLVFQGASLVTPEGGRTAPGLVRVHDRDFVLSLRPAVEEVHRHGAAVVAQLGHGALQCMELWHAEYRAAHPDLVTYAVSEPPAWFRALGATPLLDLSRVRVFSAEQLEDLAEAFGRAAGNLHAARYDGIHLAGANASVFQQLWSPVFNRRTDAFGGPTLRDRARFLDLVVRSIRRHTRPDYPIMAKIPAETAAPFFVRGRLTPEDTADIARICQDLGVDAVVPVQVGVTRDQSVARGEYPALAWEDPRFQQGYREALGGAARVQLVKNANRVAAALLPFRETWNADLCRKVKASVQIPVLCEGGIRSRPQMDALLASSACDMVGMARPFYAEPRLAHRILHDETSRAVCESCNNCTVPQITGALGVCRTPAILAKRGELMKQGAYGKPAAGQRRTE